MMLSHDICGEVKPKSIIYDAKALTTRRALPRDFTPTSMEMGDYARTILQVEMKKRGLTYRELTEKLNSSHRQHENERNIRNKIARGTFSAGFFIACLLAMGMKSVELGFYFPGKGFGLFIEPPDAE